MTGPYRGFLKMCAFCAVYLTWSVLAFYTDAISGKFYIVGCLLLFVTGGAWMVYTVKSNGRNPQTCIGPCSE